MATNIATPGSDFLNGSNSTDSIQALQNNDTVFGRGGEDTLGGNEDLDVVNGNESNDLVSGGEGNDTVRGGKNDDLLFGYKGTDLVYGDLGNDSAFGGEGEDQLFGDQGVESDFGGRGNDILFGEQGNDTILGLNGDDMVFGNEQLDIVNGNEGNDTVRGGKSNDIVRGGQQNDLLFADKANDTVYGDLGDDIAYGGEGDDQLFGDQGVEADFGGNGKDILYGEQGNDSILGLDGDDLLFGNQNSDLVNGNAGNDTIRGGQNDDTIRGGRDNDILYGDKDNDVLWGDLGADSLIGGSGDDVFVIGRQSDVPGFLTTGGATIADADYITDFGDGFDLIGLTGGLNFEDLNIFQGSAENVGNTIIQDKSTGEYLANLVGVNLNNITKGSFTYSPISIDNYLSFGQESYSVREDGTTDLAVTINRSGGIDKSVSATLFSQDVTAKSPEDYTGTPIPINFAAGETTQTVTIPIAKDSVVEGDEKFNLYLGFPYNGATVALPKATTVTIDDTTNLSATSDAGVLEFGSPTFAASENGTPIASVVVNRTGGSSGPIGAKIVLNGGTAIGGGTPLTAPADYDNSFISLNWADGDTSPKVVTVPLFNDTANEGNETVNLSLCDATGGATIGQQNSAVLTITDDEGVANQSVGGEINLLDGFKAIADDTGSVDFGAVTVGGDLTKTFTIENTNPTDTLNLIGWNLPDGFCLVGDIPGVVAPNSSADFTVKVSADKAGTPKGTISIGTTDSDENPFNFAVAATVKADSTDNSNGNGEIQILNGSSDIADGSTKAIDFGVATVGDSLSQTFTIKNSDTSNTLKLSNWTLPDGFSFDGTIPETVAANSEATVTIKVDTAKAGNLNGDISVDTNDSDENPFNFAVAATVKADSTDNSNGNGEIEILNGSTDIADGSTTAIDFGTVTVGNSLSQTFTIKNSDETNTLKLSNWTLPDGFSFDGTIPETVAANSEATVTIKVDTAKAGNFDGDISVDTNDTDENPFNFAVAAAVKADSTDNSNGNGEIEILNGSTDIADGSTTAIDFGTATVGDSLSQTFTIKNSDETNTLKLSNWTLPDGFSFDGTIPETVAANSEATVTIKVDTAKAGNFDGNISVDTNDSDENPFNFAVAAAVKADSTDNSNGNGEIQILDGSTDIVDGSTQAIDFGITTVGSSLTRTFTIKNLSPNNTLNLSNWTFPDGFSIEGSTPSNIAPNAEATFTIKVDTTQAGNPSGNLSVDTNDSDENPFNFPLTATVNRISSEVQIIGSSGSDTIQGNDFGVDRISPGAGADVISWTYVPPRGITDIVTGFSPDEDKLQFGKAQFGYISEIIPEGVSTLGHEGDDISGKTLVIFDDSINFTDVSEVDLKLSEQKGTSENPLYFLYSSNGNRYLGYDPIANTTANAVNIAQLDAEPKVSSFTFYN